MAAKVPYAVGPQFSIEPFEFEAEYEDESGELVDGWATEGWESEVSRSSADYIRWVQRSLNQVIGARLAVDGISGPMTRSAVRSFQQRRGLLVDGIVGPQTEAALIAAGATQPPGSATPSPAPTPPPPVSGGQGLAARAAQIALQEWERWGRGSITESDERMQPVLRDYWETGVGQPYPGPSTAWSGAFISWVMRQAGAGSAFDYSSAHTTYVGAAKRNRLANNSNPFKAYRITEIAPRVGDIVCKERQDENGNWSGVNYDNVDDGQFRSSHCDIVTAVRPGQLTTVGGNLSDSVKTTPVSTDAQGRVTTPRYYAVIRIEGSSATQGAFGYEAEDESEGEFGRRRQMPGRPMRYRRSQHTRGRPVRRLPRPPRRRPVPSRPAWGRYGAPPKPEPADDQPSPRGSERVRWVQSSLNQVLGLQLPVDGIMGRETRSAVRSFQEKQGLPVDGIVGPDTERALIAAHGAGLPESQPPEAGELEWQGEVNRSSRDYVKWVQQSLNQIMGLKLAVDGDLGTQTRSAIRSFQQQRGLKSDGIVGTQTERALIAAGAKPPPGASGATPGGSPIVMPPLIIQVRPFLVLDRFAFDDSTLQPFHSPAITRIAHLVAASQNTTQPIRTIRLVGHTDPSGPASYNVELGRRRALEVEARLKLAIDQLSPGLSSGLNLVHQTLGETRPVADNRTPQGRARNRRVEVFLPLTCQGFFALYDLRFLPDDPIFGIPANPNMTDSDKTRRTNEVNDMVGRSPAPPPDHLVFRRNKRAADALRGVVTPPAPASSTLRPIAESLSAAQRELYRQYLPDGAGGIDFDEFQRCFEQFANGELRSADPTAQTEGVGEPNGEFFFLFAEFAFLCIDSGIDKALWTQALRAFVKAQEIFMHVYRPNPSSPPPAVGAALPACPADAQGRAIPRRRLDEFDNGNFEQVGQAVTVGKGQSSQARKEALRAKYAPMDADALRKAARDNLRRAQCMV